MNTAAKLSAYGVALVLVAAGGWAIGTAVGPFESTAATTAAGEDGAEGAGHGDTHSDTVAETAPEPEPAGLASSRGGYTLMPTSTTVTPGTTTNFSFQIIGPDQHPVTEFEVEH